MPFSSNICPCTCFIFQLVICRAGYNSAFKLINGLRINGSTQSAWCINISIYIKYTIVGYRFCTVFFCYLAYTLFINIADINFGIFIAQQLYQVFANMAYALYNYRFAGQAIIAIKFFYRRL